MELVNCLASGGKKDILVCVEGMGVHVPCAGVEPGVSPPRDTPGSTSAQGTWTPIPFLSPHSTGARRERCARYLLRMRNLSCACAIADGLDDYILVCVRVGQHVL